jgi:HemY protein
MKLLIWLLLVAGAAVAVPLAISHGNGYVLLVQPPYRIELSTSMFLLLAVVLFLALHALLRLTNYTLQLPDKVHEFKRAKREQAAAEVLMEAIAAFAEGRHGKAEKAAAHALELGAAPLPGTLIAARSAHKLKNYDRRDFYLAEAERLAPNETTARLLCQAELLIDQRHFTDALVALRQLDKTDSRHLPAMLLEAKVRRQLSDWEQLLPLIAQLEKRNGIDPLLAQQWKLEAHLGLLNRKAVELNTLKSYWQNVPEADRLDPRIALAAAKHFVKSGDGATAAQIVEMSLTKAWDAALAEYYGECEGKDPAKQMQQAESWLAEHHHDAGLLLSLAKLCIRAELWGKAISYLEASISVYPTSAAHLALAQIMEKQGRERDAFEHYRLSLDCKMIECG